jgi:hypothetical protein
MDKVVIFCFLAVLIISFTSIPNSSALASFVDPEKDPQSYIDRYDNEPKYKEWFDTNYSDITIYQAVGLSEPNENKIPDWVRNVFVWYAENKIPEIELLNTIQFLVNEKIILIDDTQNNINQDPIAIEEPLEQQDDSQLIIFDGSYEDLLRHEDDHIGKIVKVSGYVQQVYETSEGYNTNVWSTRWLQMGTEYSQYLDYPIRLLSGDIVSGYGVYQGICGESVAGDPYTCFKDVNLQSIDFGTESDYDICDEEIAIRLKLC